MNSFNNFITSFKYSCVNQIFVRMCSNVLKFLAFSAVFVAVKTRVQAFPAPQVQINPQTQSLSGHHSTMLIHITRIIREDRANIDLIKKETVMSNGKIIEQLSSNNYNYSQKCNINSTNLEEFLEMTYTCFQNLNQSLNLLQSEIFKIEKKRPTMFSLSEVENYEGFVRNATETIEPKTCRSGHITVSFA